MMAAEETADAELVARSLAGERDAFGLIVSRHQTLVCSLAYNATGNLAQSEDLAQETFLAAWREMRGLREPAKLRAWLCGIARNTIHNRRRRLQREPSHDAAQLDAAAETPSLEPLPSEQAVTREREAILWNALERIPESYREPLILFYRQHKSVERVAVDLGLSEEVVKQRLSRGRKLLHEQVVAFVEGTLAQTTPGVMFTTAVIGALPLLTSAGVASTSMSAGGAMAKGGVAALGIKLISFLNVVIGPLLGLLATWVSVKASFKSARTTRERAYMKRYYRTLAIALAISMAVSIGLAFVAKAQPRLTPPFIVSTIVTTLGYTGFVMVMAFRLKRDMGVARREERARHPEAFTEDAAEPCGPFIEYRSKLSFLGLPLVQVRLGTSIGEKLKPAVGWIAVGDCAIGVFAVGGLTLGGVSVGGIAGGLIAIGGLSVGGLALGALVIGALAMGGVALGLVAEGFSAYGWVAAQGWNAVASGFALGRFATAAHVNDPVAQAWFAAHSWFDLRTLRGKALLSFSWLPAVVLLVQYRRAWLPRLKRHRENFPGK
jgi:RNA polymerase sigma factor (sigma-70 family)